MRLILPDVRVLQVCDVCSVTVLGAGFFSETYDGGACILPDSSMTTCLLLVMELCRVAFQMSNVGTTWISPFFLSQILTMFYRVDAASARGSEWWRSRKRAPTLSVTQHERETNLWEFQDSLLAPHHLTYPVCYKGPDNYNKYMKAYWRVWNEGSDIGLIVLDTEGLSAASPTLATGWGAEGEGMDLVSSGGLTPMVVLTGRSSP